MSSEPSYWFLDGAIDTIVADLRLRPVLADDEVQVEDAWPGQELQRAESIWIGDADSDDDVAGMKAGPINNDSDWRLQIWCDAFNAGDGTTKAARDRVTVLVGEVLRYFAEKKRLQTADNKVVMARVAAVRYRPYVAREGRGVACRIEVRMSGRR